MATLTLLWRALYLCICFGIFAFQANSSELDSMPTTAANDTAALEYRIKADIEEIRIGQIQSVTHDLWMMAPRSIPYIIGNMDDPRPLVPPAPWYDSSGNKLEVGQVSINGVEVPTKEGTVGEALCWLLRHRLLVGTKEPLPKSWCKFASRTFEPNERSPVDEWRAWCVDRFPESRDICLGSRSAFMRHFDIDKGSDQISIPRPLSR